VLVREQKGIGGASLECTGKRSGNRRSIRRG
jgi:hypothetical protein